jgi:DNA gyrase subunit A
MGELAKEILPVNIEDELKQSYLDYAMSVIVGRALPDARDGLKPVHRRVLYAMSELGNDWNKAYKKSARVVGDVIGKYHPHGDTAVYDTIVRMAQPFSLRYMLVDGQGNFGSVDGDNAAAMRYTEVRMAKLAHELLADLDKETVDWVPNYDGTEQIPAVMPTKIPNLLVNGSSGIAVGMATNIPPHNLTEVIDGCLALIDNPELTVDELMQYIPGPDFPTAGIINGRAGIIEAYRTGRGRIYMRARATIEDMEKGGNRQQIIVTELPYQLNKARLIEKIAELVKEKKIEGITELRDESDKDGMRVVIELRRGEVGEVVLNNLYAQTQMQSVFGINVVALVDGQPRTLNLKDMLEVFVRHRREVVTRRTVYELRKARERGHILEGQAVALSNIDPVIELIKTSPTPADAKERLIATAWASSAVEAMVERAGADSCRPEDLDPQYGLRDGKYYLSPEQAQAILELRLHRLTGLDPDSDRRADPHPDQPRAPDGSHPRGAGEGQGRVRRCPSHRNHGLADGPDHRRPDHRGRARRHHLPRRLRQVPAAGRLPGPASRRQGQVGHRGEGRGLHRAPAGRQQPRHPAAVLQQGQGVLAAYLRDS